MPPFQSPDEFNHFYKAYHISEGKFTPEKTHNRLGGKMPACIEEFYAPFRFAAITPDFRFKCRHITETFEIGLEQDSSVFADFANTSNYSPISYLPQATLIAIMRPFHPSLGLIYYSGRLMTFLLLVFVFYHCIKTIPVYKWLFVLLGLLPINLFIANTFSADNVTNSLAFLWITYVFKYTFTKDQLTIKNIVLLLIIALTLPLAKLVYTGLLFLLFIIPKEKFGSLKKQISAYAIISIPTFLLFWWWTKLVSGYYISYNNYHPDYRILAGLAPNSDYHQQLNLIINQPSYFFKVIFYSIFNSNQHYLRTYISSFGTQLYHNVPNRIWIPIYGVILAVAFNCETRIVFNLHQKLLLLLGFLFSLILLLLSQHLYWDPVGSGYVWLIQGRYLTPIFPLLFIFIGDWIKVKNYELRPIIILSVVILHSASFYIIYKIHYKEPFSKILEVRSGFENTDTNNDFISSDLSVTPGNHNNKSSLQKRSGNYSALLVPGAYGITCTFKNILPNDIFELEIWRKGMGGTAVLTGGGKNCKPIYAATNSFIFKDKKGWQKMYYRLQIVEPCDSSNISFFVYNPNADSIYFDDLTLIHKAGYIAEENQ
ncbi:MAG: DUF2142 domain-containing protein [Bacteroidia bacterium]|nr:DUF2142 domain-containing protein [Bacteroidia bacterium]